MIPYSRQAIDDDDIAAVVDVLKGDWLTTGPHIEQFERAVADAVEAEHAVAFANGTAALHGAGAAAGLGPGDLLVTSALTFVASANCGRFAGADVALADISPDTLNLDPATLPTAADRPIDALVPVHFAGLPFDLSTLAARPARVVIEDAAHALGARTPDGPIGNCARSDMCIFSFHPVKHVTTGEGGMVTTNSAELADALRRFRSHGTVPKREHGGWYYEVESIGFNYRLTDMQAALGTSQMAKLERFVQRRNELAERYRERLAGLPLTLPPAAPDGFRHAYHLFAIRVADRRRVYDELRARSVGTQVHYVPVYRHPLYAHLGPPERYPETEAAYEGLLSLPLFPTLTEDEQDEVVAALEEIL